MGMGIAIYPVAQYGVRLMIFFIEARQDQFDLVPIQLHPFEDRHFDDLGFDFPEFSKRQHIK
jgi:hypothetical protein